MSRTQDTLTILDVEGVEATAESVDAGDYPLARPLFIYSTASIMQEKPQVADFINFYLTYVNEEIVRRRLLPRQPRSLRRLPSRPGSTQ